MRGTRTKKNWLMMALLVIGGAIFSTKILAMVRKVPVVGEAIDSASKQV